MAYENFKDLNRRTIADKVLHDKAFNIVNDQKYDGYQRVLFSMVYKCSDKIASGSGIINKNISNKNQLKNYTNRILESLIKENYAHPLQIICGGQIQQLTRKCSKGFRFLLCVIDI